MEIFERIAGEEWERFTFSDYTLALEEDESLFDWLEKPKSMMHNVLSERKGLYSREFVTELLDSIFEYLKYNYTVLERAREVLIQHQGYDIAEKENFDEDESGDPFTENINLAHDTIY